MTRWLTALLLAGACLAAPAASAASTSAAPAALAAESTPSPSLTPSPTTAPRVGYVDVEIPNLTAQVATEGAAAPYGLRRAACHQQTRSDDEATGPLAACLAAIPAWVPRD